MQAVAAERSFYCSRLSCSGLTLEVCKVRHERGRRALDGARRFESALARFATCGTCPIGAAAADRLRGAGDDHPGAEVQ
jgi:hypothetical protein